MVMMLGQIFMQEVSGADDKVHAFCDIRVFHPNAPSYCCIQIHLYFEDINLRKKREFGNRIRAVESASFTPLVFHFWRSWQEATISS